MSSIRVMPSKKIPSLTSLNDDEVRTSSRYKLSFRSDGTKPEKTTQALTPTNPKLLSLSISPRDKDSLAMAFKSNELQLKSPRHQDVQQLIRNLGIKPAVFQSLRPPTFQEIQGCPKGSHVRKSSLVVASPKTAQKISVNQISLPPLVSEIPRKRGNSVSTASSPRNVHPLKNSQTIVSKRSQPQISTDLSTKGMISLSKSYPESCPSTKHVRFLL